MKEQSLNKKDYDKALSLHRHLIWTDYFYEHFKKGMLKTKQFKKDFFVKPTGIMLMFWLANLHTIIEIYNEVLNPIPDKTIRKRINNLQEPLKKLRKTVFHNSKEYFDRNWTEFFSSKKNIFDAWEIYPPLRSWIRLQMYAYEALSKSKDNHNVFINEFKKSCIGMLPKEIKHNAIMRQDIEKSFDKFYE